jgi:hypothetical protein
MHRTAGCLRRSRRRPSPNGHGTAHDPIPLRHRRLPGPAGADRLICTKIVELLGERAGAIPEGAHRATGERHIAECPSCAYWRESLLKAIALFGTAVDFKTPEPIHRKIEEVL